MFTQNLNSKWNVTIDGFDGIFTADVPCSMYSLLIDNKKIDDPYKGLNEEWATALSGTSCVFEKTFNADKAMLDADKILLTFHGIDTVASVYFNSCLLGKTDNMHRSYRFDITPYLKTDSPNFIRIEIESPLKYIEEKEAEKHLWGVDSTVQGFPHIRKAHYMFGWDWGPKLPDMGIWRDVELTGIKTAAIDSFYFRQRHNKKSVTCDLTAEINIADSNIPLTVTASLTAPDGTVTEFSSADCSSGKSVVVAEVKNPMLWNVRGYGEQNLYALHIILRDANGNILDEKNDTVGLRTVTVSRAKDNDGTDGEEFCFIVNGEKIFAMGANYIPEDQILNRITPERTERLLKHCAAANYNCIRVWGGGFYPDRSFYDCCDRLGILVWQDFMFACAVYRLNGDFYDNVKLEAIDNIKRLRNHPSLALWCGNNEIESAIVGWGIPVDEQRKREYLVQFELLLPQLLNEYDPASFYWPSSPSSGGGYKDASNINKGDSHYWDVWHGLKPFEDYKKYTFRFCSEYGFESLPSMKTIRSFAEEKDFDLMCPVMEAHQKCTQGTEKLMYYLAQMMNYPYKFEHLVYLSQLVQADAVRLNVENMRRKRGLCMGSLYWQVNDSNPVISWSSIDYFGRWKALHYYARKFYAPVIASVDDSNPDCLTVNISSERNDILNGELKWRLRKNTGEILLEGSTPVKLHDHFAKDFVILSSNDPIRKNFNRHECVLQYSVLEKQAIVAGGTYMFVQPKHFSFTDPKLSFNVTEIGSKFKITIKSEGFAKGVFLDFDKTDAIFSDNWFDMFGGETMILLDKSNFPNLTPAQSIEKQLRIMSYYDVIEWRN